MTKTTVSRQVKKSSVQFSVQENILCGNVKWFQGGLVSKAHRRMYHSTLGSRVMQKKREKWRNLISIKTKTVECTLWGGPGKGITMQQHGEVAKVTGS